MNNSHILRKMYKESVRNIYALRYIYAKTKLLHDYENKGKDTTVEYGTHDAHKKWA